MSGFDEQLNFADLGRVLTLLGILEKVKFGLECESRLLTYQP